MTNLDDSSEDPARLQVLLAEGFKACFATPLIVKGQVKGVLEVFRRAPHKPDPGWVGFLESIAAQAAVAIDNAELFAGLERSNAELTLAYETTLEGWSKALELRDQETQGVTVQALTPQPPLPA